MNDLNILSLLGAGNGFFSGLFLASLASLVISVWGCIFIRAKIFIVFLVSSVINIMYTFQFTLKFIQGLLGDPLSLAILLVSLITSAICGIIIFYAASKELERRKIIP